MNNHRYEVLDAMRGLAAIAVLLYHFTMHSGGVTLFASAPLAVDLFFCLSGFVIAHAYQDRIAAGLSLWGFLRLRLVRLYPAYLIGFAIGVYALALKQSGGQSDIGLTGLIGSTLCNLLYLPFPGSHTVQMYDTTIPGSIFPVNDPAWSLFFEFVANILFFLVLRRGIKPLTVLAASTAVFFVSTKLFGEAAGWGTANMAGGLARVMFSFFAGVVLYQNRARLDRLPVLPMPLLLLILTAILAVPTFRLHTYYWFGMTVLFVPPLVALGARATLMPGSRAQTLAHYFGGLSYPLYCVHFPFLLLVSYSFVAPEARLTGIVLGCAASVLVAHLVLRGVEKPLGRLLAAKIPA